MRDSTFPTELFEAIIQEVRPCRLILPLEQDDFSEYRKRLYTLCSCARTCRAWAPTSRLCLYSRLIFISTEKKSFELLVRSLDGNPWLQTLVRGLSIIDNDDDYTPPIPRYSTAAGSISHTWALMLMGKLPRLQDIGFALARGLACHTHLSRALRTFSTVTSLSLAWKHSGSFEDLLKLILVFPALRNLMIHGSLWTPNGRRELHVPPRRHFPRLTALTIESEGQDRHGPWQQVAYGILYASAATLRALFLDETSIPYDTYDRNNQPEQCRPLSSLEVLHMQVLWTLDSVHPDYHRLVEWRLHLEAPLKHLLLYYSDFAEKDGLKEYKEFLDHLVALDIALHYSSLQRLPKLTLFLTQYPSDGVDLGPSVADATRYAHANTFRLCKAKHLQLQLIWGFVQPEGRVQTYLSSTADGIMRSWSRPPPDLAHPPLSWAWTLT